MRRRDHLTEDTITIAGEPMRVWSAAVPQHWKDMAFAKGYDVVGRVKDKSHVAVCCRTCGALTCTKRFTLFTSAPICASCLHAKWSAEAAAAGLTFLRRVPGRTQNFVFRAPCGHEATRQMEFIRRMGKGMVGLCCKDCLVATEEAEASARGWTRLDRDPKGNASYRLYQHGCGHTQRIARANMQRGRFGCGRCDPGWVAAPSFIYAMRFHLSDGQPVVKLGFSRDPVSRLRFQLARSLEQDCSLICQIWMPTGREALSAEKRMHKQLCANWAEAVVAPERFAEVINVGSEVYEPWLEDVILTRLAKLDRKVRRALRRGKPASSPEHGHPAALAFAGAADAGRQALRDISKTENAPAGFGRPSREDSTATTACEDRAA